MDFVTKRCWQGRQALKWNGALVRRRRTVRSLGMIKINTDGISDEQKATCKFQSAYNDMMAQLTQPGFIDVLCAHEAAHLIYFTRAGTKEYDPLPPTLTYDAAKDDYTGHFAAVKIYDLPPWTPGKFTEWFSFIARAHAAPGLVARKLMPSSDGGDSNDKARFKTVCDKINQADSNAKIDFEWWWNHGLETAEKDLEHPDAMKGILEVAEKLRSEFGL